MKALGAILGERATALGASAGAIADGTAFARGDVIFATLEGGVAQFRLDPAVAAAAMRTPDTGPSHRGPEWVAFAPPHLDEHAADRAIAWFESAYRRAVP